MTLPALDVAANLNELIQSETNPAARAVLEQAHQQLQCLRLIHSMLDGQEYTADTAPDIARWLLDAGFVIRDLDEMDDEEE